MTFKKSNERALWLEYKKDKNQEIFQELVLKYMHMVKYHAGRIKMMVPAFIDEDDLVSYGVLGLMDAVNKFDPEKGVLFKTYASRRIRGEIIDHLRKLDWLPHSIRRQGKYIMELSEKLSKKNGKKPDLDQLARASNLPKEKIKDLYSKMHSSQWISLYDEFGDIPVLDLLTEENQKQPDSLYEKKEKEKVLSEAIEKLDEQEKLIIALVYYEELSQKEVAEVMDLSAARISQLHKKAVNRLRGILSRKKESLL
ncbi:MAG: sigma-70 family RNA polymerase sigma factor [Halanaerobiales bacterium]